MEVVNNVAEKRRKKSTTPPNEIITMTNVCKAYSTGAPALKDVNLHINRGEFVSSRVDDNQRFYQRHGIRSGQDQT